MNSQNKVAPRLGFTYSLADVFNALALEQRPRLTVFMPESIEHGKAGVQILCTSHVAPVQLLAIKDIGDTQWRYNGPVAGVPVFEFIHDHDIQRYFNFEPLTNEDGERDEGKLYATPIGWYVEQPFVDRMYKTLYATQGGGTAIDHGSDYVFVDVPSWGDFKSGDTVPREWDLQPCGTFRCLTEAELDFAFEQGHSAGRDGEDDQAPFENHEADKQWRIGYRYGDQDRRAESAMIAYAD